MPFFRPIVALTAASLCACVPAGKDISTPNSDGALASPMQTQVSRGLSFVEAQCSDCHAVRPGVQPPNSQAPSFVAVANDMGFSRETLYDFFRDGHETPDAMTIKLPEEEAEIATAYILSLRTRPH